MIEENFSGYLTYIAPALILSLALFLLGGMCLFISKLSQASKKNESSKVARPPQIGTERHSTSSTSPQSKRSSSGQRASKRGYVKSSIQEPSDRRFENYMLAKGRGLAGNQCEHTDTRTGERCTNPWQEGDHFYDYAKGGATSERNLVGACKWHNNPKSPTLKAKDPEVERIRIEKRRLSYYPANEDNSVGEWRNTGIRLTFSVKSRVHRIDSVDPDELVSQVKEILHHYAGPKATTAKLDSIITFGEMFDYLWGMRRNGTYVDNLEGVDPQTGTWVSLRKPSEWAIAYPNGNK